MTFSRYETSRSRGSPQTLYRFQYGDLMFGFTDAEDTITFGGEEYAPEPIDRGSVNTSGTLDKSGLTLTVKHTNAVAELFRVFPPSDVVSVTIFQGHETDPTAEFLAVWTGRVISCARDGTQANLLCEPVSTSMRRPGLRRRYQYGCPHALYGPSCGVDRAAFTVEATVLSVSGATIQFASSWNGTFPKANFANGILEWEQSTRRELRTILRVNEAANQLLISGKVAGMGSGASVSISLGCDHLMSGCSSFGNIQNFGGQPWIPRRNPLGTSNQFY